MAVWSLSEVLLVLIRIIIVKNKSEPISIDEIVRICYVWWPGRESNPCYRCEQEKIAWMAIFSQRYPTKQGVSEASCTCAWNDYATGERKGGACNARYKKRKNRTFQFGFLVVTRTGIGRLARNARWSSRFWRPFRSSFITAFFDSLLCASKKKEKNPNIVRIFLFWWPGRESNPCYRRERAVS